MRTITRRTIGQQCKPGIDLSGNAAMQSLREKVSRAPKDPGVYRWMDAEGKILYVGKAKNLRNRLKTYVTGKQRNASFWKRGLFEKMTGLEFTITRSEIEALILEMHLIRRHKPQYNVMLKRDKHYVFVRVGMNEQYPSVLIVNTKQNDGAVYFGPFTNTWTQRRMLDILRTIYEFRDCSMDIQAVGYERSVMSNGAQSSYLKAQSLFDVLETTKIPIDVTLKKRNRSIPCLDFHIGKCTGPCIGEITPEDYRTQCIEGVLKFYGGDMSEALAKLIDKMKAVESEQKFEQAIDVRDALSFIRQRQTQYLLFSMSREYADIIGIAQEKGLLQAVILQQRGGNIINELSFPLSGRQTLNFALSHLIVEYYEEIDVPERIIIGQEPEDAPAIRKWLKSRRDGKVTIDLPQKGEKCKLLKMAEENALVKLRERMRENVEFKERPPRRT